MSETFDCNQTLSHPLECLLLGNIYMVFGAVKSNQYKGFRVFCRITRRVLQKLRFLVRRDFCLCIARPGIDQ